MKNMKLTLLTCIILMNSLLTTSCWNYREIDKLAIVLGVAVDKGANGQYQLTAEIVKISRGKDTEITSEIISMEGKTLFDAARHMISITGKRLYWSHAKVIILSEEIASEGIIKGVEWYNRDTETREDVTILISKESTAKEIFNSRENKEEIISLSFEEIIKNQKSLSEAPITNILKLDIDMKTKGTSPTIPTVRLITIDDKVKPQILGTAIIKNDKLVGFLNDEETKDLLFIQDQVKGGLLIQQMEANNIPTLFSLEIFKSKTKMTPFENGEELTINLDIETQVSIGEIMGTENFIQEEDHLKLEQSAQNTLKNRLETLIHKIQTTYDADIFGIAAKLQEDEPEVWKRVENDWDDVFKKMKVNVNSKVHIKNSAVLSNALERR